MTVYKVLVSNINSEMGFDSSPRAEWLDRLESDEALIVLLNRIAIASSQDKPMDYPEVEVTAESRRAFITIVDGHIYYTERDSNRQNLRVVAENVPDLLKGLSVELEKLPEAAHTPVTHRQHRYRGGAGAKGGVFSVVFWCIFCGVAAFCAVRVWKEMADQPSFIQRPEFTHANRGLNTSLERYAGFYVSDYREGSLVIELEATGELHVFELWRSPDLGTFMRAPVLSSSVEYGSYQDRPALLVDSKHLFIPENRNLVRMYDLAFERHTGATSELGPVSTLER